MAHIPPLISIVIPVFNEQAGIAAFHAQLTTEIAKLHDYSFEIIYCNDGSGDGSLAIMRQLAHDDNRIRIISLTRNFGKEIASTAGIRQASGRAVISLDADGQNPVELLPKFIKLWEDGALVVVGRRIDNHDEGLIKRYGSKLFYNGLSRISRSDIAGITDFRLIDAQVQADFVSMTERGRITRGLIHWLGYEHVYIDFSAPARMSGKASYSNRKLFKLAVDGIVSLSVSPLYLAGYLGAFVLPASLLLGLVMVIDALIGDPFGWNSTGSAYVIVFMLALIGVILVSQGIIGTYLSHIHTESQNRPLYVVNHSASVRLDDAKE